MIIFPIAHLQNTNVSSISPLLTLRFTRIVRMPGKKKLRRHQEKFRNSFPGPYQSFYCLEKLSCCDCLLEDISLKKQFFCGTLFPSQVLFFFCHLSFVMHVTQGGTAGRQVRSIRSDLFPFACPSHLIGDLAWSGCDSWGMCSNKESSAMATHTQGCVFH